MPHAAGSVVQPPRSYTAMVLQQFRNAPKWYAFKICRQLLKQQGSDGRDVDAIPNTIEGYEMALE